MLQGTTIRLILGLSLLMVAVQLLNGLSHDALLQYGLVPRSLTGLRGLLFAPWLHGSLSHLLSNLLPFLVLSWLVASEGWKRYLWVVVLVCLLGGALVWLFGRPGLHVGASGLIFGLWAYLLARACYQRSLISILLALLALVLYGGLVLGFVPIPGVSFESHVFGALAGVVVAWVMHARSAGSI